MLACCNEWSAWLSALTAAAFYNRSMRIALMLAAAVLLYAGPALAAVDGITARLAGGDVKGEVKGQGKATVRVAVDNTSSRPVRAVVLRVYYSSTDTKPGDDAEWRLHGFEFDPPLSPGKSVVVKFSDNDAYEYVALDVQSTQFGLGVSYNGVVAQLGQPLSQRDGVYYIATRDMMSVIGGGISYDAATYMVALERGGVKMEIKPGLDYALVNGVKQPLAHPVVEVDGRSLLPLEDIAALFGLRVTVDEEQELVLLEE